MLISLRNTIRTERVRGFQPPWHTIWILACPSCAGEVRVRQNWHGPPPPGGILCPHRACASGGTQ